MKKRAFILLAVLLLTGGLLLAVVPELLLPPVANWLNVGGPPTAADYVFIMPGGEETRPFVAAAMIKRGLVRGVLIAQTGDSPAVQDGIAPPTREILRRILTQRGVADDQIIVLSGASNSSWDDAQLLAKFLREHPQARVAAVTNDFHTRRSRWVLDKVLGPQAGQVFFVSAPVDTYGPNDWWQTEYGLQIYLTEYTKLAAYWMQYGGSSFWGPILVVAAFCLLTPVARRAFARAS